MACDGERRGAERAAEVVAVRVRAREAACQDGDHLQREGITGYRARDHVGKYVGNGSIEAKGLDMLALRGVDRVAC